MLAVWCSEGRVGMAKRGPSAGVKIGWRGDVIEGVGATALVRVPTVRLSTPGA